MRAASSDLRPRSACSTAADRGMRLEMARQLGKVWFDRVRERWIIDVRPWGRISSIPVGAGGRRLKLSTQDLAEQILAMIRADVAKGAEIEAALSYYLPRPRVTVEVKLANWLERMRDLVDAGERSPTYVRELERYAARDGHFGPLLGFTIHELRPARLEEWGRELAKKGLSSKTRRNIVGALAAFLHWLYDLEEIERVPKLPSVSVQKYSPRIIAPATQDAILAEIPIERRGAFIALVEHALRPGEVRAFNVGDYSWKERMLTVSTAMKGLSSDAPRRGTKTGDVFRFEACENLSAWLEQHIEKTDRLDGERPLFINPATGGRWSYWALREQWQRAGQAVGLSGVRLYEGTKHSTLTALRNAGVPLDVVQRAARHKDRRTTERYAQLGDFAVVEALKKRRAT